MSASIVRKFFASAVVASCLWLCAGMEAVAADMPESIFVGGQAQHVQGIAYDAEGQCMYMSFTSRFLKVDLKGNVLASIDRIQGHLGAMTFDPVGRKVYASLECKDDQIGQGIAKTLSVDVVKESVFYIAIIDVDKLDKVGADPEDGEILRTVCLLEPCEDYSAEVNADGSVLKHRFGCSGVDGVTIAPAVGSAEKSLESARRLYLYVAYGIYGEIDRKDNDYQVMLQYDLKSLDRWARPVKFGTAHLDGPKKPLAKYFIFTGNTTYGVQNLAYDPFTGDMFMAVYKGKKKQYPNYGLYAFSLSQKPFKAALENVPYMSVKCRQLRLDDTMGLNDPATGIHGWNFKWGSTGLDPLGDGLWYISQNFKSDDGKQSCRVVLYRWTGSAEAPFEEVTDR